MWVGGCGAAEQPLPLTQLLSQCDSFKGKSVQVGGYLDDCAKYSCQLFTGKPGSERFVAVESAGVARSAIGIGGDNEAFDQKAAPLQRSYVVVTGRVDDRSCDGQGGTDRSPGLHPSDIRASTMTEAAPAKLVVRNS
ncbi:hypothetical protein BXU08_08955 [Sphingomonas sp. LM7]|nr:hypothetical protein BXU08_08955 [Sphingomonas sp. LM7]